MKLPIFIILASILLMACNSGKDKKQSFYHGFTNNSWLASETVSFPFEIADTSLKYNIRAQLRYTEDFSFSTFDLSVTLLTPAGSSRYNKIHLNIRENSEEKNDKQSKDYLSIPFILYSDLKFKEDGKWILNFNHHMPVDIYRGLVGLEVFIEPA